MSAALMDRDAAVMDISGKGSLVRGSARRSHSALRLTRRGRLLVVLAVLAVVVGAGLVLGRAGVQAATGAPAASGTVTVRAGDTLWSIADRIDPGQDPRIVVAALESENGLTGATVVAGQQLRIPAHL